MERKFKNFSPQKKNKHTTNKPKTMAIKQT